jgi:hypothetical protein
MRTVKGLWGVLGFVLVVGGAGADTLVMRNGQRIEGLLVGVRGDTIEFEHGGRHVERYDRSDVRRIEIDAGGGGDRDDHRGESGYGSVGGYGRPSGMRERSVSVGASQPWSSTGIELRRGQEVYFEATGKVRWGHDRNDGPAGERGSPHNPARPIPDRPGGALIGRIGDGDPFYVGDDRGPIRVRESGRLFLGINDDYLVDNAGEFRVTVYY